MADALLSPAVSAVMTAASIGSIAYSVAKLKKEDESGLSLAGHGESKIPVMGVMGAFVFAAQMINFTIPATGSSGHIGGGILLAAMLGPYAALLTISAVLIIQCLFFADGGLMALGCNIFNMGVYACFVAYPFIFKPMVKRCLSAGRITAASIVSVVVGLQIGALSVVLETMLSGVTELPFSTFVLLMQPIHLAIGVGEGIITAAVLCFVLQMRPDLLDFADHSGTAQRERRGALSFGRTLLVLLALAALIGGGLSLYASAYPDGLEWSMEKTAGTTELERTGSAYETAAMIQERTAFMPDYDFKSAGEDGSTFGTTTAGIVGGAMTLLLACAAGAIVAVFKRHGGKNVSA
ncbi:MAG: energy-coupling factor ABC transporter permease [Synergistaceae bacterium]|jgi:cobalt/nickel transport system permease protein|nr:energy-coupling factor ABC transporter permease [Synergistaceae bacterium]